MADIAQNEEIRKKRGLKEIEKIESFIKQLDEYVEYCVIAEVMERINDALKELRKARIKIMERYDLDIDDLRTRA